MPVIAVGEAAAGPAHYGDMDLLQAIDHLFANAVDVGDARAFAYPYSVIDDAAKLLGELAIDFGGDGVNAFIEQDFDMRVGCGAPCGASTECECCSGE